MVPHVCKHSLWRAVYGGLLIFASVKQVYIYLGLESFSNGFKNLLTLQKEMKREREDTGRGRGWTGRRKRRQTEGIEGRSYNQTDRQRGGD